MVTATVAALVLALAAPASAATVSVQLETDHIEVNQTVRASVVISGFDQSVNPGTVPRAPGVLVQFAGSSSGMNMIGRTITRNAQLSYSLTAQQEGDWTVGPFDVYVDGVVVTTDPVVLHVSPSTDKSDQPTVSVSAFLSATEAWEGQVLLYRYGYEARVRVGSDRWALPELEALRAPRDGLPTTSEVQVGDPSGPIVRKETVQPYVAVSTGDFDVGPATAGLAVVQGGRGAFGFARTRNTTLSTEPSTLTVRALPSPPAGFSGLVGDFVVQGRADSARVRLGDSVTWTVSIQGDGVLDGFALPQAPDVPGLRFYDSVVGASADVTASGYASRGQWQRVVVPTESGTVQVPPMDVVTFSPTEGRYVTHTLTLPPLEVRGDGGQGADVRSFAAPTPEQTDEPVVDDDIRPARVSGTLHTPFLGRLLPWLLLGSGVPGLLLWGVEGLAAIKRRRGPVVTWVDPLAAVLAAPLASPARLAALEAAVREVSDRADGERSDEVQAVLSALGRVRYAGDPVPDDLDQRAVALVRSLRETP